MTRPSTRFGLDTPPRPSVVAHDVRPRVSAEHRTTLTWMKTISHFVVLPKPKPVSTNHLSTTSLATSVWSVSAY